MMLGTLRCMRAKWFALERHILYITLHLYGNFMMIRGRVEPGYEYLPLCVQVIAAILLALPPLSAQSPLALKDLTVPAQSLPSGCKLKPARGEFLGANTNPWITTDRRSVGLLSMFVSLTAGEW